MIPNHPLTSKNKFLITSALPYINGIKHLGNLVGSMLPADLYARYLRLSGKEVLYICATDEHGTPAELAALEHGKTVQNYCTDMYHIQKTLGEGFDLSWDYFGRSSAVQNHELTQYFYQKLNDNGLIYEKTTQQVYSHTDKRFLPDRYVEGTCPHCGYEKARGDQCESCTRVLDPTDLINPYSVLSKSTNIEIKDSKHLFLKQASREPMLRHWIESKKESWSVLVTSIAEKWLNEGLQDRGITRDLSWGVCVPREGFEEKVFYVWFDAPIAYISATKEYTDSKNLLDSAWQAWWQPTKTNADGTDDVTYVQFMAKDNIPFHTVSFPITIFGANDSWKAVDHIKGFNWLNYYGGKFSTSSKRGVFMNHALELYPSDYWRWYLLSNVPENTDTAFTWETFQIAINKDLADVLGNFVNRITRFTQSKFGLNLPAGGTNGTLEQETTDKLKQMIADYKQEMQLLEIRKAANHLRSIWVLGNEYLQQAAPWTVFKTDPELAAAIVRYAFGLIKIFGELSKPFIPQTADKITNITEGDFGYLWQDISDLTVSLPAEQAFELPDILFTKIEDSTISELKERFGADA